MIKSKGGEHPRVVLGRPAAAADASQIIEEVETKESAQAVFWPEFSRGPGSWCTYLYTIPTLLDPVQAEPPSSRDPPPSGRDTPLLQLFEKVRGARGPGSRGSRLVAFWMVWAREYHDPGHPTSLDPIASPEFLAKIFKTMPGHMKVRVAQDICQDDICVLSLSFGCLLSLIWVSLFVGHF